MQISMQGQVPAKDSVKVPEIHLIAAQTRNRVIGLNQQMPWHLPRDLAHFKASTMGYPVIMGRKTYETLGKALPKRANHVISRNGAWQAPDAAVHQSLEAALAACGDAEKVFIIGGGELYRSAMGIADELNITWIEAELAGDTFFPEIDEAIWQEVSAQRVAADEKNAYALCFSRYRRRAKPQ